MKRTERPEKVKVVRNPKTGAELALYTDAEVERATLPERYRAAVAALAKCLEVDECQDWANRAEAMRSYAKQSKDTAMERAAMRIKARAIQRCGQLMKEIPKSKGGTPVRN